MESALSVGPVREIVNRPVKGMRRKGNDDSSAIGDVALMLSTGTSVEVCAQPGQRPKAIATMVKADPTFIPTKDGRTRRWNVFTERGDYEILTTGCKWYDTRAQVGGGGAIDLAMHVLGLSFVDAVKRLSVRAGSDGRRRS